MISGNNTTGSARIYRRVDSLVKTGVPVFLLATPLRAYTLTHSKMGKYEQKELEGTARDRSRNVKRCNVLDLDAEEYRCNVESTIFRFASLPSFLLNSPLVAIFNRYRLQHLFSSITNFPVFKVLSVILVNLFFMFLYYNACSISQ